MRSDKVGDIKIALVSLHGDPEEKLGGVQSGGQNVYVKYLMEGLAKKGFFVDVFVRKNSRVKNRISQISDNLRIIRLIGGPEDELEKDAIYDYIPNLLEDFFSFNYKPYDVFHGNYWLSGKFCLELQKELKKTRFVETFHSLGKVRHQTLEAFKKQEHGGKAYERRLRTEFEIIKNFDKIIATSKYEMEDLKKYYLASKKKIAIVPCGVSTDFFRDLQDKKLKKKIGISKNEKVILYVGRLEWRKGLGTLIYAVNYLVKEKNNINLKLIVIGGDREGDDERKRLETMAKKLNIEKRVDFIGRMGHEKLRLFYSMADMTVIPSYYEPFGLVALESMACGTPIVASRVGGLQFSVIDEKTGLLCKVRNFVDMANKIDILLSNDKMREKMGMSAKKRAKNLDWEKMVAKISRLYFGLLK